MFVNSFLSPFGRSLIYFPFLGFAVGNQPVRSRGVLKNYKTSVVKHQNLVI